MLMFVYSAVSGLRFYGCYHPCYFKSTFMVKVDFITFNISRRINKNRGLLRDKIMADKVIYIPNDDAQNTLFCR